MNMSKALFLCLAACLFTVGSFKVESKVLSSSSRGLLQGQSHLPGDHDFPPEIQDKIEKAEANAKAEASASGKGAKVETEVSTSVTDGGDDDDDKPPPPDDDKPPPSDDDDDEDDEPTPPEPKEKPDEPKEKPEEPEEPAMPEEEKTPEEEEEEEDDGTAAAAAAGAAVVGGAGAAAVTGDEPKEADEEEPMAEEPMEDEPMAEEPMEEEPMAEEPMAEEPMAEEPMDEDLMMPEEAIAEEPLADALAPEDAALTPEAAGPAAGPAGVCTTLAQALGQKSTAINTVLRNDIIPAELFAQLESADAKVTVLLPPEDDLSSLARSFQDGVITQDQIAAALSTHIITEPLSSTALAAMDGEEVTTANPATPLDVSVDGATIEFSVDANMTATVTEADIDSCGTPSFIHSIDKILTDLDLVDEGIDETNRDVDIDAESGAFNIALFPSAVAAVLTAIALVF